MKTPHFLLIVLVLMWGVLAYAALTQSDARHSPRPHPEFGLSESGTVAMDIGGDPYEGPWAWLFGTLVIVFISGCMWLMSEQTPHATSLRLAIGFATICFLAAFCVMCWSDAKHAGATPPLWLGFPEPTTWMLMGIWFPPLLFVVIYVWGFHRWFASESTPAVSDLSADETMTRSSGTE